MTRTLRLSRNYSWLKILLPKSIWTVIRVRGLSSSLPKTASLRITPLADKKARLIREAKLLNLLINKAKLLTLTGIPCRHRSTLYLTSSQMIVLIMGFNFLRFNSNTNPPMCLHGIPRLVSLTKFSLPRDIPLLRTMNKNRVTRLALGIVWWS